MCVIAEKFSLLLRVASQERKPFRACCWQRTPREIGLSKRKGGIFISPAEFCDLYSENGIRRGSMWYVNTRLVNNYTSRKILDR